MKVTVLLVAGDQTHSMFTYDLARLMAYTARKRLDLDINLSMSLGSLLVRQRDKTVQGVLDSGSDFALFLDADMRFPKDGLVRLLSHDLPVVGCNYSMRNPPFEPTAIPKLDEPGSRLWQGPDATGLIECEGIGLGFALVRADALRAIERPRFMVPWSPAEQDYAGEDMYFCNKLKLAGFQVFVDQDLTKDIGHIGNMTFGIEHPLAYREHMQAQQGA